MVSEKLREANRQRSRKPRGKWAGTKEREQIEKAKALLREGLPDGARFVLDLIRDENEPKELRLAALKFAAERAGLPVQSQQDVNVTGAGREVWVVGEGLGWPEATGATVEPSSDHDDRSDQPSVQ